MTKLKAFPYYGGKLSHLNFILKHLPYTERYIEPFGGSAAVLLNREPSPVETFNDLDGGVVNFFRVLREKPDELVRQLELTPHSRKEFVAAHESTPTRDSVERARRFFVQMSQGYNARTGISDRNEVGGSWSSAIGTSRRGMSMRVAQTKGYLDVLHETADRLSRVQIENRPAIDVIERHDHPDALIYCDPPYAPDSRKSGEYAHDMSEQDHRELARTLRQCESMVAISNYESDLIRELYEDWNVITGEEKLTITSGRTDSTSEILITNYDPTDGNAVETVGGADSIQNRLSEFASAEGSE